MKLKTLRNKYAFAYTLFALGLVLGSCSQEESDEFIPNKEAQSSTLTFTANPVTAETKGVSTKVSITPQRNNDVLNWEENDKVTFYFLGDNYEDKKTYTVSVDGSNAFITGDKPGDPDEYKILALYPDRSSNFSSSATILTIPDVLTQKDDNSHLKDYIYMYARPDGTVNIDDESNATGGNIALDFTLLTSLLRFEIENTSSSDVTLKSVTISYPNDDAKLYSRVALDEDNSVVYPANGFNSHASMTLNFSDLLLEAGEDTQGNLCVFPTTGASALNIDINLLLPDGTPQTIEYVVNDISVFAAGNRYVIPLPLNDADVVVKSGSQIISINGQDYMVYRTNNDGEVTLWMVDPLRDSFGSVIYQTPLNSSICPNSWTLPTRNDLEGFYDHLSANPDVLAFLFTRRVYPDLYLASGQPNPHDNIYYLTRGRVVQSINQLTRSDMLFLSNTVIFLPEQQIEFTNPISNLFARYPVRCVKK